MHLSKRFLIFWLATILSTSYGWTQGTGNNPFSQYGIGDLNAQNGSIRNIGMGYAGTASRQHYFINLLNPALLCNMRSAKAQRPNHTYLFHDYYRNLRIDSTVKIDFALTYQNRGIHGASGNENSSGMNVQYLTFALPLTKTWATAVGIQPYSTANYNLYSTTPVSNNSSVTADKSYTGKGGVYKIFWSHGVGITHYLSAGVEAAYLFGNINNESLTSIGSISSRTYGFRQQNNYSGLLIKPGLLFRREIVKVSRDTIFDKDSLGNKTIRQLVRKTKSSGVFYNIGLTYELQTNLNIRRELNLYSLDANNRISLDTSLGKTNYKAKFPPSLRLGFSLDKPLKWSIAADVYYTAWSVYKPTFQTEVLGNSYGVFVGGEITPAPTIKLRSKTYRVGFSYVVTPILLGGKQVTDVSASIGATIPLGKRANSWSPVLPRINLALVAGQRGDIATAGIKEQYVKVYLSLLINEKWFTKRKIY